jgi:acetyltransferase-like isoleucine patch superfamily enzyme
MHSENHNFSDITRPIKQQGVNRKGIKIGSGCWIGAKVTVLDGAVIGNGCVIAAGSVVTAGKYDDNCIYGGVPAKFLKSREA